MQEVADAADDLAKSSGAFSPTATGQMHWNWLFLALVVALCITIDVAGIVIYCKFGTISNIVWSFIRKEVDDHIY